MSENWFNDIEDMHYKFGVREWVDNNIHNKDLMKEYLKFRMSMIEEEFNETLDAIDNEDSEEIVDGLIDLCVFAIGTLELFEVNGNLAWDRIYEANMSKSPGVKPGRPNPWGMPDLIKPDGWESPNHEDNHGHFSDLF